MENDTEHKSKAQEVTDKARDMVKFMKEFYKDDLDDMQFVKDCKTERTREIILLLSAFDLDEAIEKIEKTYRDDLDNIKAEKETDTARNIIKELIKNFGDDESVYKKG